MRDRDPHRKFRSKRLSDDEIEYRGWTIRRRDEVPTGYYGRYTVHRHGFSTQRDAKAFVDGKIKEKEAATLT